LTFKTDSSDFDDTRVSDIRRGLTTEAQVRALVGRPSGMYIHPLTRAPDERDLVYVYGQKRGTAPLARKQLLVTIDSRGVVRDVQYEKTGDW
jgi:outer membrane protein assembly factor BamE (lipoprotein component of BamABCDE complex)